MNEHIRIFIFFIRIFNVNR